MLAGVTTRQLESALGDDEDYFVMRTMPNIACFVRGSATVIESPHRTFPDPLLRVADAVFRCVGRVFYIKTPVFDVCTALCGSSPAFLAVVVEATGGWSRSNGTESRGRVAHGSTHDEGNCKYVAGRLRPSSDAISGGITRRVRRCRVF